MGKKNGEFYRLNRFSICSYLFHLLVFLFELGLLVVGFLVLSFFIISFSFFIV